MSKVGVLIIESTACLVTLKGKKVNLHILKELLL